MMSREKAMTVSLDLSYKICALFIKEACQMKAGRERGGGGGGGGGGAMSGFYEESQRPQVIL